MTRKATAILMTCVLGAGATLVLAEELFVKDYAIEIREGRGSTYPVVGIAEKGSHLTVLERKGKFLKVQAEGLVGWVNGGSMSDKKPANSIQDVKNPATADVSTGAAVRGLDPLTAEYGKNKGYSTAAFDQMVNNTKAIKPAEWEAFTKEGKVGPDKP